MGSDKHKKDAPSDEAARLKKEKKEKKRSEKDGVHKKERKDKKDKKNKQERLERALDEHLQASAAASVAVASPSDGAGKMEDVTETKKVVVKQPAPKGALVSFALPLADEKVHKKVYKTIKKATKKRALLRGVKEVNKALRKAPAKTPGSTEVPGIVVIAGDISPAEVIMHLPVYCEERNVPYLFVNSRAELGAAAKTKRPTSVVMLLPQGRKKAAVADDKNKMEEAAVEEDDEEDADDYPKVWQELVATAQKEFGKQLKGML